jgi:hypothetical protein
VQLVVRDACQEGDPSFGFLASDTSPAPQILRSKLAPRILDNLDGLSNMNDRQAEELLALEVRSCPPPPLAPRLRIDIFSPQAIYPDLVSWVELPDGQGVEVKIAAPVVFEEPREVEVIDWPASATKQRTSEENNLVEAVANLSLEKQADALSSTTHSRPRRGRRNGSGGGGGGEGKQARLDKVVPLAATAEVFQPRCAVRKPVPPNGTRQMAPATPTGEKQASADTTQDLRDRSRVRVIPAHEPPPPRTDVAQHCASVEGVSGGGESLAPPQRRLSLRHLPSIQLSLRLPPGYPDTEPPTCITISDADRWLDSERRRVAERKLADLYAGDECLLYILDSVSSTSSEFDATFSLKQPLILRQTAPMSGAVAAPGDVIPLSTFLVDYDRHASSAQFATSSHSCPLCFTTQRGSSCIRIASCGCVFCVPCLKDYFSLLITEGLVRSVACPSRNCVESRAQWEKDEGASKRLPPDRDVTKPGRVTASEVEELVGEEGRKRWEWLQEKARVESGEFLLAISFRLSILVSRGRSNVTILQTLRLLGVLEKLVKLPCPSSRKTKRSCASVRHATTPSASSAAEGGTVPGTPAPCRSRARSCRATSRAMPNNGERSKSATARRISSDSWRRMKRNARCKSGCRLIRRSAPVAAQGSRRVKVVT